LLESIGRFRRYQIHRAAAKSAARHSRAVHAWDFDSGVHQKIDLFATDLVIVLHAAMRRHKQPAHFGEIAAPRDSAPSGQALSWQARLALLADQHWTVLLAHPWLLQIAASRPLLGPNMTGFYDAELAAVDGLGLTDIDMDLIVSLLDDYVRGAARGAVEAAEAQARTGISDQQWWQTYGPLLADVLDPARYPTAVRVGAAAGAEFGAAHDAARSFRFGLQRIIDGIALFVGQTGGQH